MTAFLYYRPGAQRLTTIAQLRDLGLGYAFDSIPAQCGCGCGPDDQGGIMFSCAENLGYYADKQRWKRIPGSACWLGLWKDNLPTPDDLARSELIAGYALRLDDGHDWIAPCAKRWEEFADQIVWRCNLPIRFSLDDAGQWQPGDVKPRYARLWDLACKYEEAFATACRSLPEQNGDGIVRFDFPEINDLAVAAFQTNYRVAAAELDMLGIYDAGSRQRIIDALVDADTWRSWAQKKITELARAGMNSSSGPGEWTPAAEASTDQPLPSCEPMPPDSTETTDPVMPRPGSRLEQLVAAAAEET